MAGRSNHEFFILLYCSVAKPWRVSQRLCALLGILDILQSAIPPLLLLHNLIHRLRIIFHGLDIHLSAGLHAKGADLAGHGGAAGLVAGGSRRNVSAGVHVHGHGGGAGDGILVGCEEEKLPALLTAAQADEIIDVMPRIFTAGVLQTIGEDGDDDLAGLIRLLKRSEARSHFLDGAADGIQQRGAAAGDVDLRVEFGHILNGHGDMRDQILIIKEHQGEPGVPGDIELGFQELIEATDGGLLQWLHGAGAVQDVGDFNKVRIHKGGGALSVGVAG